MPGFDLKIHGEYPRLETLRCPSCKLILREAIQTEEGIRLCKSCYDGIQSSGRVCPNSGFELDPNETIYPDIAVRKEVNKLPVKCTHFEDGCPWIGTIRDFEQSHQKECPYRIRTCSEVCTAGQLILPTLNNLNPFFPARHYETVAREDNCINDPFKLCQIQSQTNMRPRPSLPEMEPNYEQVGIFPGESPLMVAPPIFTNCLEKVKELLDGFESSMAHIETLLKSAKQLIPYLRGNMYGNISRPPCALEIQETTPYKSSYHEAMLLQCQRQKSTLCDSILSQIEKQINELARTMMAIGCVPLIAKGHSRSLNDLVRNRMMLEEQRVKIEHLKSAVCSLEKIHADHVNELDLMLRAPTFNGLFLWRIPDIQRRKKDAIDGKTVSLYSPPFYTGRNGYKMCIRAYLNGDGMGYNTHVSLFFALMKGEYDPLLKWPFDHDVALIMVDQEHKNHIVQTFKPSPDSICFQRPTGDMNIASGCPKFAEVKVLADVSFVKDDVLYIIAIDLSN